MDLYTRVNQKIVMLCRVRFPVAGHDAKGTRLMLYFCQNNRLTLPVEQLQIGTPISGKIAAAIAAETLEFYCHPA